MKINHPTNMTKLSQRSFIAILVLAAVAVTLAPFSLQARAPKTEDELIADLASPKDSVVAESLQKLEKDYPNSPKSVPAIKNLLGDPRPKVARKAARVLGAVNADVSDADLAKICELLKSPDKSTIIDGLKALRGLKSKSVIPQMLPLLKNPDKNVIRDTIRTLAVVGDNSLVPTLKPFLEFPDLAVQKDAADAIGILKEK
jgi:HEAT repeat protein